MQAPESLKFVRPYVQRANETEKSHPLIAYFCRMQAISKIIAQGAHNKDEGATKFADQLMTDLEAVRKDPELDAEAREILESEEKGREYVQEFAQGVLVRAQRQIAEHKVTPQTAMTLLAAATFLDLVELWPGSTQGENIKFAKYHAARIIKAVKEGVDPNTLFSDPEFEQELEKELEELEGAAKSPENASNDTSEPEGADTHAPQLPDTPRSIPTEEQQANSGANSADSEQEDSLPSVPGELPGVRLPETPSKQPNNLGLPEAPEDQPDVVFEYEKAPSAPRMDEFAEKKHIPVSQVSAEPQTETPDIGAILSQAETTKAAQKHAKFAISALNYDDYATAISELEKALRVLKHQ